MTTDRFVKVHNRALRILWLMLMISTIIKNELVLKSQLRHTGEYKTVLNSNCERVSKEAFLILTTFSHTGPRQDAERAKKFILNMYVERHVGRHKALYTHYTCATDTENIRIVFKSVKDTLLQENLEQFNLEWQRLMDQVMVSLWRVRTLVVIML